MTVSVRKVKGPPGLTGDLYRGSCDVCGLSVGAPDKAAVQRDLDDHDCAAMVAHFAPPAP